jgi:hypothetical protein
MRRAIGLALVLGAVGLGVWQIAQQQTEAPVQEPIFPPREEMWKMTMQRFDSDGDLQLSHGEFDRYQTPSLHFEDFDQDRDGYISIAELETQIMRREPRPLMDLKIPDGQRPMVNPDQPVDSRQGRVP